MISRLRSLFKAITSQTMGQVHDSYVRLVMEYMNPVWYQRISNHHKDRPEAVHNHILGRVLGAIQT